MWHWLDAMNPEPESWTLAIVPTSADGGVTAVTTGVGVTTPNSRALEMTWSGFTIRSCSSVVGESWRSSPTSACVASVTWRQAGVLSGHGG